MAIMRAHVVIGAKLGPLRKALAKMRRMVASAVHAMESAIKKVASITIRYTKYIAAAYVAIGVASAKMASAAVESENLFTVSMGKMAAATREWSEELSTKLKQNSYDIRKMVGVFNVMLGSMGFGADEAKRMSETLTELTYDMSSFYNLPTEEAFTKLQAGITGLVKPLRILGILVHESVIKEWALANGMIESGQEMTMKQKIIARYNVILEQTTKAQGDLLRTIGTTENVYRSLWAVVKMLAIDYGRILLPAVTKVGIKMRDWLTANREGILKFGAAIHHAIGAAARVLTVFIQPMLDGLTKLGKKFSSFATESKLENAIWAVGEWVDRIWAKIKLLYTMITDLWKSGGFGESIKWALMSALSHIIRWTKIVGKVMWGAGKRAGYNFTVQFSAAFAKFAAKILDPKGVSLYDSPLEHIAKLGLGKFALGMLRVAKGAEPPKMGEVLTKALETPEYKFAVPPKFSSAIDTFKEAADKMDAAIKEKWAQIRKETENARVLETVIDYSGIKSPGGGSPMAGTKAAGSTFGFSAIRESWSRMVSSMQADPAVAAAKGTTRAVERLERNLLAKLEMNSKREARALEKTGTHE